MGTSSSLPPELLLAHAGSLRRLARSLALDSHAADDVAQDTFLRALVASPEEREGIGGWLHRVAAGFAGRRRRAEGRRAERERRYASTRPEASLDTGARAETLRTVVDAVLALEEPYRETVLLRWFEDLPPRAIAVQQGVGAATVNSRLRRAHALLRERLQRRLDVDERALGVLLIESFGGHGAELAVSPSAAFSLAGIAMTTKLLSALGFAALGLCAFLYCDGSVRVEPLARADETAAADAGLEATAIVADAPAAARAVGTLAPATISTPSGAAAPREAGPFEFELTFVPIDALGRPIAAVDVWIGPESQSLVRLGSTAWNGALHATWLGYESRLDLVVLARRDGFGATPLRRVTVVAGRARTIVLGLDVEVSAESTPAEIAVGATRLAAPVGATPLWSRLALDFDVQWPSAPEFRVDTFGNGVFEEPFLACDTGGRVALTDGLGRFRLGRASFVLASRAVESASAPAPAPDERTTWIHGVVRDQAGAPIPHAAVTVAGQRGAWRADTTCGAVGAYVVPGIPLGTVEILVGGGKHALRRQTFELESEEPRALDFVCPELPLVHGRLVDDLGAPLAAWHVEARARDGHEAFLARATTDVEGRFELALSGEGPVRLLARRAAASGAPKRLVAERVFALDHEQSIVVRGDLAGASIRAVLEGAVSVHPGLARAEVRAWRVDSGEGVRATLREHVIEEDGARQRLAFGVDDVLPGSWTIEVGVPGSGWKTFGPFLVVPGKTLTLDALAIDEPARVALSASSTSEPAKFVFQTRRQGACVESACIESALPAEFIVAPGQAEIVRARQDSTPVRSLPRARAIQCGPGARVEVDLDLEVGAPR